MFDDHETMPSRYAGCTTFDTVTLARQVDFDDYKQLPSIIPQDYADCISNRNFKKRVIGLIIEKVVDYISLTGSQSLIIDYAHCPILFNKTADQKVQHSFMKDLPAMGECDVKFTRWIKLYGNCILHSVDGDFVPIALIEYERYTCIGCEHYHGLGFINNMNILAWTRLNYQCRYYSSG